MVSPWTLLFRFGVSVRVKVEICSPSPSTFPRCFPVFRSVKTTSSPKEVARTRAPLSRPTAPPVNIGLMTSATSNVVLKGDLLAIVGKKNCVALYRQPFPPETLPTKSSAKYRRSGMRRPNFLLILSGPPAGSMHVHAPHTIICTCIPMVLTINMREATSTLVTSAKYCTYST
jgi:hypothetical protein